MHDRAGNMANTTNMESPLTAAHLLVSMAPAPTQEVIMDIMDITEEVAIT